MDRGPTSDLEALNARRRRRFRARFPLAYAASYLLDGVILALFAVAGTVSYWVALAYTLAGCSSATAFYRLLLVGFREHSSDKFLMLPQLCIALTIMCVFLACAPSVGFFFLGTIFIVIPRATL